MDESVSIVIVTWNNERDIQTCLKSILDQTYQNYKVIVVDNASTDNTVNIIENYFPSVKLIKLPRNLYLTGGNNTGIKYALDNYTPEFVMVLNPDTKVEKNLISTLMDTLNKNEDIGAAGPKIKFWDNQNEGLLNSAGLYYDGFMQAYDRGFMQKDEGQFDKTQEVFGVTGTCILYRVKMLKQIGLYWDAIKMYMDETEMFIRAHKHGWKVFYTPKTTVWHNYMQSTNANKSFNKEKQGMKAWLMIALRHYPIKSKLAMLKKYLIFKLKKKQIYA
jgi:GT2 family glycosyltransferase